MEYLRLQATEKIETFSGSAFEIKAEYCWEKDEDRGKSEGHEDRGLEGEVAQSRKWDDGGGYEGKDETAIGQHDINARSFETFSCLLLELKR